MEEGEFYTFLAMAMAITESGDSYPCVYEEDHGKGHGCIYHSFKASLWHGDSELPIGPIAFGKYTKYHDWDFVDILKEIETW